MTEAVRATRGVWCQIERAANLIRRSGDQSDIEATEDAHHDDMQSICINLICYFFIEADFITAVVFWELFSCLLSCL